MIARPSLFAFKRSIYHSRKPPLYPRLRVSYVFLLSSVATSHFTLLSEPLMLVPGGSQWRWTACLGGACASALFQRHTTSVYVSGISEVTGLVLFCRRCLQHSNHPCCVSLFVAVLARVLPPSQPCWAAWMSFGHPSVPVPALHVRCATGIMSIMPSQVEAPCTIGR